VGFFVEGSNTINGDFNFIASVSGINYCLKNTNMGGYAADDYGFGLDCLQFLV